MAHPINAYSDAVINEKLDSIKETLSELKESIGRVYDETRKTNGRVNGHDTALALLQQQLGTVTAELAALKLVSEKQSVTSMKIIIAMAAAAAIGGGGSELIQKLLLP